MVSQPSGSAAYADSGNGWLQRQLSHEPALWRMAAILLGAISLAKGLRYPNSWSATQAMVNYDFGLTKRGLFGATLGHWLHLERYARFSLFSYILLLLLLGLLALLTRRAGTLLRLGAGEPVAIFFAGYAVTYLAHLAGYLDIPLAILSVGLLLIRNPWARLAAAVPVCVTGLLIHEMFFLVFLPAILFSLLLDGAAIQEPARQRRLWAGMAALSLIALATTLRLALERPMTDRQVQLLRADIAGRADFPVREYFFLVMTRSSMDNFVIVRDQLLHNPVVQITVVQSAIIFLLPTTMLLLAVARSVRAQPAAARNRFLLPAAVLVSLSPLAMYLLGYDFARWDALACLQTFCVLSVLTRAAGERVVGFGRAYRNAAVLVVAIGMASGEGLMDGQTVNTFPFLSSLSEVVHTVRHHGWVMPKQ